MDKIKKNLNSICLGLSLYIVFIKLVGYVGLFPKINKFIYKLDMIPNLMKNIIIFIIYYTIVYGFTFFVLYIIFHKTPEIKNKVIKKVSKADLIGFLGVTAIVYRIFWDVSNQIVLPILKSLNLHIANNTLDERFNGYSIWFIIFGLIVVTPIAEEYIFRKIILNKLRVHNDIFAVIVTGFLFGLIHANINQFIYTFPLGIVFGIAAIKSNGVWLPIILHMFLNIMGSISIFNNGFLKSSFIIGTVALSIVGIIVIIKSCISAFKNRDRLNIKLIEGVKLFCTSYGCIVFLILCIIDMVFVK